MSSLADDVASCPRIAIDELLELPGGEASEYRRARRHHGCRSKPGATAKSVQQADLAAVVARLADHEFDATRAHGDRAIKNHDEATRRMPLGDQVPVGFDLVHGSKIFSVEPGRRPARQSEELVGHVR